MRGAIPTLPQYVFMEWWLIKHRDIFNQPTNSMEQITSWEVVQKVKIPHLSWNLKVHYHIHKCPPLAFILSHMNPVHTFPHYFPNIHSNIILPSTPRSSDLSYVHVFRLQFCMHFSSHRRVTRSSHLPRIDNPNNVGWNVQVMKFHIIQSSSFYRHFIPLTFKYSPQLPVLEHLQSMFFR
jgi:hypothetical protein